jgi:thiamine-monophosphate kinase
MVTAMQDLSDGLATDLAHICEASNVGARVMAGRLPGLAELKPVCSLLNMQPTDLQVSGGEDYHLVFTVAGGRESELEAFMAERGCGEIHRIGSIIERPGVGLIAGEIERDISFQGYAHGNREKQSL